MRPNKPTSCLVFVVVMVLAGCSGTPVGDDGGAPEPEAGAGDATTDATPDADGGVPACDGTGPTGFFVISTLDFGRMGPAGTVPGLNLDGLVSDDMDRDGCFQPDFVSAHGTDGVDNQFAVLLPTLESALGADTRALFQQSINAGDMLILLELSPWGRLVHRPEHLRRSDAWRGHAGARR